MSYGTWIAAVPIAVALLAGAPTLRAQTTAAASASVQAITHEATGTIAAVEPDAHPQTVVIQSQAGNRAMTIGADVFDQTKITEGNTEKSLTDLKVGERVWIRWKKTADTLVADSIRILKPGSQTQG